MYWSKAAAVSFLNCSARVGRTPIPMAAIRAATIVIALEIDSGIRVRFVMRPICPWHPAEFNDLRVISSQQKLNS